MDYPKFIVSNQKEESISIQRSNTSDFYLNHSILPFLAKDVTRLYKPIGSSKPCLEACVLKVTATL